MSWTNIKYYDVHFYTPSSFYSRTHKLCRLPNGLLTLLISDPSKDSVGCSLTIATGSHDDPDNLPGLAHLCEHMILAAGSKRYPNPGVYHEMIATYRGSQNAFTTGEQTTFYFELPSFHHSTEMSFEKALDIFSSFFIQPLFLSRMITKEICAIESEHNANTSLTSKILYHATRLLANQSHPFHRFATGSMWTLKTMAQAQNINIRSALHEFFEENYVSTKMTLCIRGPQSVNSLTRLANDKFGNIQAYRYLRRSFLGSIKYSATPPEKSSQTELSENHSFIDTSMLRNIWQKKYGPTLCFSREDLNNTLFVSTDKGPVVRLVFPIHLRKTRFRKADLLNFSEFWLEMLGDESEGSMCYYLMQRNMITSCYAFKSEFATDNMGLILELHLTNTGWKDINSILSTILFELIPFCTKQGTLELAMFLSDQYCIDLLRFISKDAEDSPMQECSSLTTLLQEDLVALKPEFIFKGSPVISSGSSKPMLLFNESEESRKLWIGQAIKFQSFLKEFFSLSNMRLILFGDLAACPLFAHPSILKDDSRNMITDAAFGFQYAKCEYEFLKLKTYQKSDLVYHFPVDNPYKPEWATCYSNLSEILTNSSSKSRSASLNCILGEERLERLPRLVSQNEYHETWVLPEEKTDLSKSTSIISLETVSLEIAPSPENTMSLEILVQILSIVLSPDLYPSLKLAFSYEISCSNRGDVGLSFTISGFSDGLMTILIKFISIIRKIALDPEFPSKEVLRRARVFVRNIYEDACNASCVQLATMGLLIVLENNVWTLEDRLNALEDVDVDCFKGFCKSFLDSSKYLYLFVQGDISCTDEVTCYLNESFTYHLRQGVTGLINYKSLRTTRLLEPGANLYIEQEGSKLDPNSGVVYFIQTGSRSDTECLSLSAFTDYLLSISLVSELRNKRQVGYLVMGGLRLLSDTVGLHITVMSGKSCIELENDINEYLCYVEREILNKLDENGFFERYVRPFIELHDLTAIDSLTKSAGPVHILSKTDANVKSGDPTLFSSPIMRRHKKLRDQISNQEYKFSKQEAQIDINVIINLTLSKYKLFYEEKISIHSMRRSKISIMIKSTINAEELKQRRLTAQLEYFLKVNGLEIDADEIRRIVEISNGKVTLLIKELYPSLKKNHEVWAMCSIMFRETCKLAWKGIRVGRSSSIKGSMHTEDPAISLQAFRP